VLVGICRKFPLSQYAMEGISMRHLAKFQWTGLIFGCGPLGSCSMIKHISSTHCSPMIHIQTTFSGQMAITHKEMKQRLDGDRTSGQRQFKCNICWEKINGFSLGLQNYCQLSS
jgi:hypothetical protein